ncbi:MAG: hypothetical protein K8S16_03320 [Bacteroidales bacterium]|nr:hypothetical protein [Bacteroidales bacterium]
MILSLTGIILVQYFWIKNAIDVKEQLLIFHYQNIKQNDMNSRANIFLVEDDHNFGSVLKAYLERGYFERICHRC